jgi:uncharacterized protein Veg
MKVKEVYNLKDKFSLGQRVEVHRSKENGDEKYYSRQKTEGIVVGVYDYFVVIDNGKYRESFSYADIAMGKVRVKAVRAA